MISIVSVINLFGLVTAGEPRLSGFFLALFYVLVLALLLFLFRLEVNLVGLQTLVLRVGRLGPSLCHRPS